MLYGFRAGPDPALGLVSDDFTGTRAAWGLTPGTAPIGRAFPNGASIGTSHTPGQVVTKMQNAAAPVLAAGMWPYLSLKPNVADTIAGRLDAHLTAVGRWAAGLGVPLYFSPWHEPENDPMGAAASDYLGRARNFVAMCTRVYEVLHAAAGDAVLVGPCHMGYQWRPGSATTADGAVAAAWRVADNAADFYACDTYTSNWSWETGQGLRDKADFQRWLRLIDPPAGSVVLAERGISRNYPDVPDGPAAQAGVLFDDGAYLTSIDAHALMYWNSGGATDDSVFQLGEPGRGVFALLARAATEPEPPADRYQEGYDTGYAAGTLAGRADAFGEAAAWCTSQINTAG